MRSRTSGPLSLLTGSLVVLTAPVQAQAQTASHPQRTLTCRDGDATLVFGFDGKGGAVVIRREGRDLAAFPDLQEKDWSVRVVVEQGAPMLRLTNVRGAALTVPALTKTVGKLTWNDPPGAQADLLCDLAS